MHDIKLQLFNRIFLTFQFAIMIYVASDNADSCDKGCSSNSKSVYSVSSVEQQCHLFFKIHLCLSKLSKSKFILITLTSAWCIITSYIILPTYFDLLPKWEQMKTNKKKTTVLPSNLEMLNLQHKQAYLLSTEKPILYVISPGESSRITDLMSRKMTVWVSRSNRGRSHDTQS